jgi:hypothetical protein
MAELKAPQKEIDRLRGTGRNDACPCGSEKKYKKCHLREDEEAERAYLVSVQEANVKAAEEGGQDHECGDPDCEDGHGNAKKKAPLAAPAKAGPGRAAPKRTVGSQAANAQRSMPRKAQ